mgnify:FL=1
MDHLKCPKCGNTKHISVYPEWKLSDLLLLDSGCDAKCNVCGLVGIVDEFMLSPKPLNAHLRPPQPDLGANKRWPMNAPYDASEPQK